MVFKILQAFAACFFCLLSIYSFSQKIINSTGYCEPLHAADSGVRHGELENGFRYSIAHNEIPDNFVSIQFAVRVGYLQEDETERGLAHVLEHVALKGTANYPLGVYYYLEKLGITRGVQINASTGLDATLYILTVPADNFESIKLGLNIVRDISNSVLFRDNDIEIERESVLSEISISGGVTKRMLENVFPAILRGTRYAERGSGIEDVNNVRRFKKESLVNFYRKWYRPNLQFVTVVGPVQIDSVESYIRNSFCDLKNPEPAEPHVDYEIFVSKPNELIVFSDRDQSQLMVSTYTKYKGGSRRTICDIRESMTIAIYNLMVERRLQDMAGRTISPLTLVYSAFRERGVLGLLGIDVNLTNIKIDSVEHIESDFKSVMRELFRLKKHGFTADEFQFAKKRMFDDQENSSKLLSRSLAQAYCNQFIFGDIVMDRQLEMRLDSQLINDITLDSVNTFSRKWTATNSTDIVVLTPDGIRDRIPPRDVWFHWLEEVEKEQLSGNKLAVNRNLELIEPPKTKRGVTRVRKLSDGIFEIALDNGVRVVLKPTVDGREFEERGGRMSIHGFKRGGASSFGGKDYFTAICAAQIVSASGLGNLNSLDFSKVLLDKDIEVGPYVDDVSVGIRGTSRTRDFEFLLHMVYEYLVSPPKDEGSFKSWKDSELKRINSKTVDISVLDSINYFTRERSKNITAAALHKVDMEDCYEYYCDSFGDIDKFIFVITGSFNIDGLMPQIERYLGAIRSTSNGKHTASNANFSKPSKKLRISFLGLDKEQTELRLVDNVPLTTYDAKIEFDALNFILQRKLTARFREVEKGVYAVSTAISYYRYPFDRIIVSISFSCSNDKVDLMIRSFYDELNDIKKGNFDLELENYISSSLINISAVNKSSSFWDNYISFQYLNYSEISDIKTLRSKISKLDKDKIILAAAILKADHFMEFVLHHR